MRLSLALLLSVGLLVGSRASAHEPEEGGSKPVHHRTAWPQPTLGASRSGAPEILFTFDDGPEQGSTDAILDTLARHGVRAVFFVVARRLDGAVPRAPVIIQRMLDERHAVGNHTWHHKDLCLRENAFSYPTELDAAHDFIRTIARMSVVFFRAPYGARCPRLEVALEIRGLRNLHWDIDPQEWRFHDATETSGRIISKLKALRDTDRAVILIHDTKESTAHALPTILDWLDAENQRRIAEGRRPIHVLEPAQIAVEQLAPGLASALGATATRLLDFLPDLERRLLSPISPPLAKVNL